MPISHFILTLGVISVVMLTGLYIKDMIMVRLQNANALLHRELQMDYIKKLLYTEYKYLENKEYLTLRDRAKSIIYSVYSHPGTTEDYIGMSDNSAIAYDDVSEVTLYVALNNNLKDSIKIIDLY